MKGLKDYIRTLYSALMAFMDSIEKSDDLNGLLPDHLPEPYLSAFISKIEQIYPGLKT